MIAIIDYGAGNLKNVKHALKLLEIDAFVTDDPDDLAQANGMILPGVGAFGEAMKRLESSGFVDTIKQEVDKGTPLLGICLGMQLLFDKSYEHGEHAGLGLIEGEIVRFSDDVKVPHMGWNQLALKQTTSLNEDVQDEDYVYFVHSYYAQATHEADILHETVYGKSFTSAVKRDHVMGIQYHPEKSSRVGMQLLKNFGEMVQ
ncbi:imidazole glycerol phosphate synthase subunit HisH [Alkalibacillus salilacus]|uniref:Imidazole glycerol phosphate synthase subunit HisH n=1 Tax=Alkalibacillus salilacus TaxID=284582 RepID=A0ABT9VE66_9BACI|nr:imidazole glycerol phosphate synthase subunit HisH [Alkalibacillus salilacus]MDQ0159248.1 glutamine amidotransferase [Alkalibacillus salilacus]